MPSLAVPRWNSTLLLLVLALGCGQPDTRSGERLDALPAMAVWSYRDLTGSEREQAAFFEFAAGHGVKELFLGGADLLPRRADALAEFLAAAQRRGIGVSLVLGRAAWIRPDQRPAALQAVLAVRDFDLAQGRAGRTRLTALQLDVEPHALPDWGRDGTRLSGEYLDLLDVLRGELVCGPPLHVDIPVWWHGRPVKRRGQTRPLSDWVIQLADRTVLMDYRNKVGAILDGAEGPLAAADALGRPVLVGLAVHCDRNQDNAVISFCKLGEARFQKVARQAETRLSRHRSYAGMAVFTYEDWLILKR